MKNTKSLFDKALSNFDCARIIRKNISNEDEELINLVGYHLQQSVELSIKYTLEINGIKYPNVHRIEDLIKLANDNNINLHINEYIEEHDALLSSWEANTRYIVGYLIELKKVDKAISEIEIYFKNLIDLYNNNQD
ncbi:MAG: HEPN domain-containing protein [Erysipelotrichaceae bacterium]|nr:HEPN domain-containing protein [Erysipelotrichaceae bacterium]